MGRAGIEGGGKGQGQEFAAENWAGPCTSPCQGGMKVLLPRTKTLEGIHA